MENNSNPLRNERYICMLHVSHCPSCEVTGDNKVVGNIKHVECGCYSGGQQLSDPAVAGTNNNLITQLDSVRRVPTHQRGSSFMSATRCDPFSSDPLDFQRANDFHRWTPLLLYYNWHRGRAYILRGSICRNLTISNQEDLQNDTGKFPKGGQKGRDPYFDEEEMSTIMLGSKAHC
ncbi:hypothetical protein J6590_057991 [Homalodisca vitripennis]|nr:hypothetical protein J6590_057991 [Homalodisca vitripennis]